jgi:hypothetical protein
MKVKFHIAPRLNAEMLHAVVEHHPRMQRFRQNMARRLDSGDAYAHALSAHILRRVVGDLGDVHLNAVMERLGRIETLREKIDLAIDGVLDGHGVPKEFTPDTMETHFAALRREMDELTAPREALIGDAPIKVAESVPDYSNGLLTEFDTNMGSAREHGQFGEPLAAMKKRFTELPDAQRDLLRRARDASPADLEAAVTGNEVQQQAALQRLRQKMPGLNDAEFKALTDGIQDIGRARTKGFLVDAAGLQGGLEKIGDLRLREVVASGDPWIVQSLAVISPGQLEGLWQAFIKKNPDGHGFSGYVRGEMVHYTRSVFGEHTAAFGVPEMDYFLKGPDLEVRKPGTDLVGIGKDHWTWILEDKSHLSPRLASATAIFENLPGNLEKDAQAFRARERELKTKVPKYETPLAVDDAIQHMQAAANDIRAHLNALPEAQRLSPDSLARMRSILDQHRIKLRITSGFGEVTQISQDLARLGIRVKSTGPDIKISH